MNDTYIITVIAVMAMVTIALRFLPFILFDHGEQLPKWISYLGKVLPPAIMSMLLVYCLRNINLMEGKHGFPELICVGVTILIHHWKRNTLLSIGVLVGFVIAMILRNTRFSGLNVYIDPMMVIMVSVVFIKMPVQSFINAFKEILCVKADDEINDDIYLIVKEIEKEYKFEDSISRVSKIGGELRIEIDFIYNEESKLKDLDQMDCVREEVYDAIKHIDYNKWLNVSFTGDKKWAI